MHPEEGYERKSSLLMTNKQIDNTRDAVEVPAFLKGKSNSKNVVIEVLNISNLKLEAFFFES